MKKLKITSPFNLIVLFVLSLTTLYVIFYINNPPKSKYSINQTKITGKIYECQNMKDKTILKINAEENILINYYGNFNCKLGLEINATGKMNEPSHNTNFYLFDYKNYLLSEKINYTFTATNIQILNTNIPIHYQIKNFLYDHIQNYKSKHYLNALVLGNDDEISEEVKTSYQTNGITHLLAISGAQITLFATILLFLFNKMFSKSISYTLTILILLFYLFITNFQASILRATIFFIILTINKQFELKINTLSLLVITMCLLLIINPYFIYSLGFTLSFTVSFFLLLFKKIISRYPNFFSKTLVISLIAFFASAPIIINSFFRLNLLSPFINLYFVPLVTFLIYPLALITFIFKPLDIVLLNAITIMENVSLKISNIDLLNLTLCHINIFFFIIYYVIITLILYYWQEGKNYIIVLFIILIIHHNINYLNPVSSLTMIDVGQGDSFLIKLKHNKGNILIDTGGIPSYDDKKYYDLANNTTIPYLRAEGIDQIDYLITTHGDLDHMGESINLINNFKVDNVIFNGGNYNELELELINLLKKKNISYYNNIQTLNIKNYKLFFLNNKIYDDENDNSNVIYTNLDGINILLTGDATEKTEKEIIQNYNLPNIDILKVAHHGSSSSTTKSFVNSIQPKYSIISVGKNNTYGHPNREVLKTLSNSTIYRTDLNGSVKFTFKETLQIETCIRKE